MPRLLLDTHAAVWLVAGVALQEDGRTAVRSALADGGLLFSAVSAWEIGLLVAKGRLHFSVSPHQWISHLLRQPGMMGLPLSIGAAVESSHLPGDFHADPADRLLVASARVEAVTILTRDRRILDYAAAGHVEAQLC